MNSKMICFIGARGGSKGVKRKNLRTLGKKPLIAHTIESALDSGIFKHVVVSTEDKEIATVAKKFGAEVPFMRPKKLASDTTKFPDVMIHGIKKLEKLDYVFDSVTIRDCTVPFITKSTIKKSVKKFYSKKCDCVASVYRQHLNPYFNIVELKNGFLQLSKKPSSPVYSRQQAPVVLQLNGLFVFSVKNYLKHKSILMPKLLPYEISAEEGLTIDTEIEFLLASLFMKKINK
jgi:CMP-N,N'-diacetyllegionaminic acid synthase